MNTAQAVMDRTAGIVKTHSTLRCPEMPEPRTNSAERPLCGDVDAGAETFKLRENPRPGADRNKESDLQPQYYVAYSRSRY
jgi:hypothetical protein